MPVIRTLATILLFLSTPSARRATIEAIVDSENVRDFYPRPPRGGRRFPMQASGAGA